MIKSINIIGILIILLLAACNNYKSKLGKISSEQRNNEIICMEDSFMTNFDYKILGKGIVIHKNFTNEKSEELYNSLSLLSSSGKFQNRIKTFDVTIMTENQWMPDILEDSIVDLLLKYDFISEWNSNIRKESEYMDHIFRKKRSGNYYFVEQIRFNDLYDSFLIYVTTNQSSRFILLNFQKNEIRSMTELAYYSGDIKRSTRTNDIFFFSQMEIFTGDIIVPAMDVYGTEEYPEGYVPQSVFCYRFTFDDNGFLQFIDQ